MHRLIITAMLAFAAIAASAQTVIEGTVADAQGKHVEAYVSVAPKGTGNILVFADTDAKGHYRLEFTTEADSVTVSASGLAIGSHTKQVANRSQRLDFCVKEQAMQLKEVTVRAQKIRQNGDTLSYLVGAYQQQGDRVIGDVLKHMPGIEVADNGGIKYNGKTIKKFYVEEMDLLQGRYGLATNNINASDVATVQVLEHHQPVKMLQDKELSDDVAINLKLKNSAKGTVAINTMLGGGAQQAGGWHIGKRPLTDSQAAIGQSPLWTAEVVGMYFAKRRQNMTLYKGNNTGDDVSKELTQHYSSVNSVSLYPFCPTGALMPNGSGLPQKRTFDNHSQILTMNHLEKPNKDTELGLNIAYYNDRIRREGSSVGDQFVSDDSRLLASETMTSETKLNNLNIQGRYNRNAPNGFVANVLKVDTYWNSDRVDGLLASERTGAEPHKLRQQPRAPAFRPSAALRLQHLQHHSQHRQEHLRPPLLSRLRPPPEHAHRGCRLAAAGHIHRLHAGRELTPHRRQLQHQLRHPRGPKVPLQLRRKRHGQPPRHRDRPRRIHTACRARPTQQRPVVQHLLRGPRPNLQV